MLRNLSFKVCLSLCYVDYAEAGRFKPGVEGIGAGLVEEGCRLVAIQHNTTLFLHLTKVR